MTASNPDPGFDPARRKRELAKIHIGAKRLLADEDAYRDMLEAVAGVRSAGELDADGRRKVIEHLKACGATFRPAPSPVKRPRPRPEAEIGGLLAKIDALCINHPSGRKPREWAEGILQQMTKHPHRAPLEWATPGQLHEVIQAIEVDVRRRQRRGDATA